MPQVTFYALSAQDDAAAKQACALAADAAGRRQRCSILCPDQQTAERVDELLWQLPAERFVPHNLFGEGPGSGTPVEICWQQSQLSRRPFVINLSQAMLSAPQQHQTIIDFVPQPEEQKQAARIRYKQYQQAGCTMQFLSAEN
ncbi:DNA polymerase III subunit chi [Alteromonas aestuariivivens]|uniref:DNA polymerase III subunit chi n=1 Tax=Alteromonas aestuariivivens TaxID=1938339 RepID=A0A3D8MEA5_9ALTE|nr:DNA polymerase III subunit chi [Alteromonas aestuariivivens]RDV28946.1 DNA polymerase III subunit chi [Alteromonas aestuariivivens]